MIRDEDDKYWYLDEWHDREYHIELYESMMSEEDTFRCLYEKFTFLNNLGYKRIRKWSGQEGTVIEYRNAQLDMELDFHFWWDRWRLEFTLKSSTNQVDQQLLNEYVLKLCRSQTIFDTWSKTFTGIIPKSESEWDLRLPDALKAKLDWYSYLFKKHLDKLLRADFSELDAR